MEQEVRMQLKGEVRGEGGLWVINAPNTADNPLTHTRRKLLFHCFSFHLSQLLLRCAGAVH